MFVVTRKPYGCARLPMGHFKGEVPARTYAADVFAAFPGQEIAIAEEADNGRTVFVDVKPSPPPAAVAAEPEIAVERLPKGGK